MADSSPATIEDIRTAIDAADEILLRAIAARMKAISYLTAAKKAKHLPVEDLARENALRTLWKDRSLALGVRPELALLVLDLLLEDSKRLQGV